MTYIAPVAQWPEPPDSGAALPLSALVPFETTAGYMVFVRRVDQPAGSTEMSLVDSGSGYDAFVTPVVTTGRRLAQNGNDLVFLY